MAIGALTKSAKAGILYIDTLGRVRARRLVDDVHVAVGVPNARTNHERARIARSIRRYVRHLKDSVGDRVARCGRGRPGTLPKNCHLLPSTAIL